MNTDAIPRLKMALLDLDMEAALESARSVVEADGANGARRAVDAVAQALEVVGKRFQDGEWFVAELVYSGEIAKETLGLLAPLLAGGAAGRLGTVVVGTVAGDLHDLGKNIFANYATSAGFEIVDLGIDVPAARFVAAAEQYRPLALGLSCLLTITAGQVRQVLEALDRAGIRGSVKVIVGGAALTEQFAREVGADAFAPDAVTGTDVIKAWSAR